jgi:hypothetical protein
VQWKARAHFTIIPNINAIQRIGARHHETANLARERNEAEYWAYLAAMPRQHLRDLLHLEASGPRQRGDNPQPVHPFFDGGIDDTPGRRSGRKY